MTAEVKKLSVAPTAPKSESPVVIYFNRTASSTDSMLRKTLVVLMCLAFLPTPGQAQTNSFLRFVPGASPWQGELQTSITRYRNQQGQQVELIAAAHIADPAYYETLNSHFESLDLLLYELVADDEDWQQAQGSNGGARENQSLLGTLQSMIGRFLELEFQLQAIDYGREHYVRADLSATELAAIMQSKDESFFSMFMTMAMAQMAAEQNALANGGLEPSAFTLMSLITALSSDNQSLALKYLIARELGRSGDLALSPTVESRITILGDRNKVALATLKSALAAGEQRSGLFYGAAHMPGLERELLQTMGFSIVSRTWLTAWNIP